MEMDGIEPTTCGLQSHRSPNWATSPKKSMGLDRIELSTSRLSGARSNQLSYRPVDETRALWRQKIYNQ